jgi:hypothetical protein
MSGKKTGDSTGSRLLAKLAGNKLAREAKALLMPKARNDKTAKINTMKIKMRAKVMQHALTYTQHTNTHINAYI